MLLAALCVHRLSTRSTPAVSLSASYSCIAHVCVAHVCQVRPTCACACTCGLPIRLPASAGPQEGQQRVGDGEAVAQHLRHHLHQPAGAPTPAWACVQHAAPGWQADMLCCTLLMRAAALQHCAQAALAAPAGADSVVPPVTCASHRRAAHRMTGSFQLNWHVLPLSL